MFRQRLFDIILWVRKFIRERFHSKNEDLAYYVSIAVSAIIFIAALNAFVELTDELAENELTAIDERVTEFVLSFRSDVLTRYFAFVTDLGDRYAYITITVLLAGYYFFRHRSWKFIVQISTVLILATLSNVVLKQVINRQRPVLEHLVTVNTLSYPSGHSMAAMAFYGFLIYLCLRYRMQRWLRICLLSILVLLIFSIGVSRIYLGVHFPTDVAAGFIGGLIWIAFCAVVFDVFELWRNGKNATAPKRG